MTAGERGGLERLAEAVAAERRRAAVQSAAETWARLLAREHPGHRVTVRYDGEVVATAPPRAAR